MRQRSVSLDELTALAEQGVQRNPVVKARPPVRKNAYDAPVTPTELNRRLDLTVTGAVKNLDYRLENLEIRERAYQLYQAYLKENDEHNQQWANALDAIWGRKPKGEPASAELLAQDKALNARYQREADELYVRYQQEHRNLA